MTATYESGYNSTISLPLSASATSIEVATAPTRTKGRMKIYSWNLKERISYTGVSWTTLTGVTRWLSKTWIPATAGTGLPWIAWTKIKLVAMHDQLPDINEDTAFTGSVTATDVRFTGTTSSGLRLKTLTEAQRDALTPAVGDKIINSTSVTEQTYYGWSWNDNASGTTPAASTTVAGKVEISTDAENTSGASTGWTGALLTPTPAWVATVIQSGSYLYCGTNTTGNDTFVVSATPAITAYTEGMKISFKSDVTNSWGATINVNGLWAKAIQPYQWYNIPTGRIIPWQIVNLTYHGSAFYIDNPQLAIPHEYGDGSDGDVTISGTVTLTSDMYYNNLTIPSGQTLDPNGYRVFVKGTMSGTGTISRPWNNGAAASWGTGGAAATTLNQWTLNAENAAGAGANAPINWSWVNWSAWASPNPSLSNVNWSAWGGGWAWDWGSASSGWAWWTATRWVMYNKLYFPHYVHPATAQATFGWLNYKNSWAAGGGWSGADTAWWSAWAWGGWGGNGWVIWLAVNMWNFTGTVTSTWWAGWAGSAWTATGNQWGWGGWGGGNGWVIFRIYRQIQVDATFVVTWWAGWAGAAGNGTWAAWSNGTAWSSGTIISLEVL